MKHPHTESERREPLPASRPKTFRELVELIRALGPPDEEFVDDLQKIHRNQPPMPDDVW